MAIEVEKKYRLTADQFSSLERRLNEENAENRGRCFETNILFSNAYLKERDAFIRLRKTDEKSTLTFKKSFSSDGGIKSKLEFETEVADFEAVSQIVSSLGLKESIVYEKRRATWDFEGVEVVLDELPFGLFMEIEGDAEAIGQAESRLEAGDLEIEHQTYPLLTLQHGTSVDGVSMALFADR